MDFYYKNLPIKYIWFLIEFYFIQSCLINFKADQSSSTTNDNSALSKRKKSSEDRKETSFTILTILYCLVYFIGNFIDDVLSIFASIANLDLFVKYGFINITGNILFFASHGVHFFLFYGFNKVFRKRFKELFNKIFWNQYFHFIKMLLVYYSMFIWVFFTK